MRQISPLDVSQPKRANQAVAAAVPTQNLAAPKRPNAVSTRLSPDLGKQMKQAKIHRLDRRLIQIPLVHSSHNDDVKRDAFAPADMTYAGKQRRGIRENFESCASSRDHVRRSMNERFPLAAPIPLPEHI